MLLLLLLLLHCNLELIKLLGSLSRWAQVEQQVSKQLAVHLLVASHCQTDTLCVDCHSDSGMAPYLSDHRKHLGWHERSNKHSQERHHHQQGVLLASAPHPQHSMFLQKVCMTAEACIPCSTPLPLD
jgi:hypothetical protein